MIYAFQFYSILQYFIGLLVTLWKSRITPECIISFLVLAVVLIVSGLLTSLLVQWAPWVPWEDDTGTVY